jgi:DNA-binding XRE family transcriptional regulator
MFDTTGKTYYYWVLTAHYLDRELWEVYHRGSGWLDQAELEAYGARAAWYDVPGNGGPGGGPRANCRLELQVYTDADGYDREDEPVKVDVWETSGADCPACGSADMDATTWEVWCITCDWRADREDEPTLWADVRADAARAMADLAEMTPARLRHMRTTLGLSQETLGRLLGVKRATVANWELGRRSLPASLFNDMMTIKMKLDNLVDDLARRRAA